MEDRAGEHPFFGGASGPGGPHPAHFGGFFGHGPHGFGGPHHDGEQLPHRGGPPAHPEDPEKPAADKSSDEDRAMPDDPVPDPPEDAHDAPDRPHHGRHRRCGGGEGRGRGGWGGRGGGRGWGHHHGRERGHHGFPGGGFGGWGRHGAPGGLGFLSELFGQQQQEAAQDDWRPEADVFDTEGAFVVHVSLPGAAKEDIGVGWDPEKSELSVAGVVHRPGDEAFLKTLALDERRVGAFERRVRLGTRSTPAQVDVDGISARLENGILLVEVPKLKSDFVEVKKVDIE